MHRFIFMVFGLLVITACEKSEVKQSPASVDNSTVEKIAAVDSARIIAADNEPQNWLSHGRNYQETRFSPLDQVNDKNVNDLGLAWSHAYKAPTKTGNALEATPIVVDGRLFTTGAWGIVYAFDAKTGEKLWQYDPKLDAKKLVHSCCGMVNRGVAVWEGNIIASVIDGRIISIDAKTGKMNWEIITVDQAKSYTITGAPRVIDGKIIIGNGGGEFDVRGYVTAYDASNGEKIWRFYTVPGNPEDGFENPAMEMAAETWSGDWWTMGGGGTAWDSFSYDPELDLLYIGVGNGSPWNHQIRSNGIGDNLFLSSIVAVKASTGEYVWHYQTTPGENSDYTATQQMILTELEFDGKQRKVIMQAPKNGFFYVLDRASGELLKAEPFGPLNWASHVDMETGRPVEAPEYRQNKESKFTTVPGPLGSHNWQSMSYNPKTGLVYIPTNVTGLVFRDDPEYTDHPGRWNIHFDFVANALPTSKAVIKAVKATLSGPMVAFDPIEGKVVWSQNRSAPWNGGTLTTAGNLVFQGTADGYFTATKADSGEEIWRTALPSGVLAAPISYSVDGEQYIALNVGWGSSYGLLYGALINEEVPASQAHLIVFKLGAKAVMPERQEIKRVAIDLPARPTEDQILPRAINQYMRFCTVCHGELAVAGGILPDLRFSPFLTTAEGWRSVVHDGVLAENGMAPFKEYLSETEVESLRQLIISFAHDTKAEGIAQ